MKDEIEVGGCRLRVQSRGVIYVDDGKTGACRLRVSNVPKAIVDCFINEETRAYGRRGFESGYMIDVVYDRDLAQGMKSSNEGNMEEAALHAEIEREDELAAMQNDGDRFGEDVMAADHLPPFEEVTP